MKRYVWMTLAGVVLLAAVLIPMSLNQQHTLQNGAADEAVGSDTSSLLSSAADSESDRAQYMPSDSEYTASVANSGEAGSGQTDFAAESEPTKDTEAVVQTPEASSGDTARPQEPQGSSVPAISSPAHVESVTSRPAVSVPAVSAPESTRPSSSVPASSRPASSDMSGVSLPYAEQVIQLVNQERAREGLGALTINRSAAAAAQTRAREIVESFSHTRPDGTSFSTALAEHGVGYRRAGENIAWGQKTPVQVMDAWMNSPGHRANILNADFTSIGVGYYQDASGRPYWTQLFIG